ncbi:MAG TPA: Ig-like domain repeat protein [Candidatus Acidoferrum sp.]|nr:Ig-like domain repeat protein [Candidatus Acidoferrum sp.]
MRKILLGIMFRATIATGLLLAFGFAQPAAAQNAADPPNVLGFGDNFIVSGDFAIGATGLGKSVSGFASGTISIGNGKDTNPGLAGTNTVPQGAQIVEALLYWQTVEIVGGATGQNGFFMPVFIGGPATGYPIMGTSLTPLNSHVYWDGTGCASPSPTSKQLVTYRADVRGLLPQDANGNVIANGDYQVTIANQSNGTPLTLGVTLVLVYRVLSPTFPLNAVVIYNGTPASTSNMPVKMVGFYDAATIAADFPMGGSPVSKLAYIAGNGRKNLSETVFLNTAAKPNNPLPSLYAGMPPLPGWYGGWDSATWFFGPGHLANPLNEDDSTATTVVQGAQQGCVTPAAIIYSTTAKNTDGDGHLDSWKKAMPSPGYCDAVSLNAGICHGSTDPGWVDLTGAHLNEQDLFVQLDYMCSSVDNNTCDNRYDFNPFNADPPGPGFGPLHLHTTLSVDACPENVIQKVVDAFADLACQIGPRNNLHKPINLLVKLGNAVAEQTCQDNNPSNLPFCGSTLQAFPNQPGVVGWKGGFAAIKNQLVDASGHPVPCAVASPPPGCAPRFQHGKKDSWHYVLFGDQLGLPNLSFIGGTLAAGALCPAGTPCVAQTGNVVTVYTTIGHGLTSNVLHPGAPNARVTIADGFTNPNLDGIFLVTSVTCPTNPDTHIANDCSYLNKAPGPYTFTINIGNSASATYTRNTDPNLSIVSGLPGTGSGFSDLGGQDSLITLANWGADANPKVIAGTFMHELGHSLGLSHGGLYYDNLVQNPLSSDYRPTIEANCKANFPSVMTYHYQRTLIDNFALDYAEEWLPQVSVLNPLGTLDENGVPPTFGFSMFSNFPFNTPPYLNTFWYVPFTGIGDKAKAHCDGTPIRTGEKDMTITTGASTSISWTAPQDINFDGAIETVTNVAPVTRGLRGHSDWAPTFAPSGTLLSPALDLRQMASTGNLSVTGGSSNIGGGSSNIGGGSSNLGGGSSNIGGGSSNLGGGSSNIGGGNGDLDRRTADAVTLPPSNLTATEGASARTITITLNWNAPGFGQIVKYKVYRSDAGGPFNLIGTVVGVGGNPPATTFTDSPACNTGGHRYEVTAVIINPDTSTEQESGPSNTVSATPPPDQDPLTGCPEASLAITPTSLTNGVVGAFYSQPLSEVDEPGVPANPPFNWTLASGSLPNGITLGSASGTLSGTSCVAGSSNFTVQVTDVVGDSGTQAFTLQINMANTTTSVMSSANPSVFQQMVTFTVTVAPNSPCVPTGTVTLFDGATQIGSNSLSGGMATFTTSALLVGVHSITASYSGDANFNASNTVPPLLSQVVNKANTTIAINSVLPSPAFVNQPISVAYTLAVSPLGAGTPIGPTGTVTVAASDGSGCVVPAALGAGACVLVPTPTTAGPRTFTATYSGDSNFNFIPTIGANGMYTVYKLVFTVQPSNTGVGLTMTPAVRVSAQDSSNTTLLSFTGGITLSIGSGPGTLSGTTTQNAVSGVATFGDLSINKVANGYTLVVSPAGGFASATSNVFNIDTFYVDGLGNFGTLDLATGVATQIGSATVPGNTGLDLTPNLSVYEYNKSNQLMKITPSTGAPTLVGTGTLPNPNNTTTGALTTGSYFAIDMVTGILYSIDLTTGATTQVGSSPTSTMLVPAGCGFEASLTGSANMLYYTIGSNGVGTGCTAFNDTLYVINPTSGATTTIGQVTISGSGVNAFVGSAFVGGTLYGFTATAGGQEYAINPATGVATFLTNTTAVISAGGSAP